MYKANEGVVVVVVVVEAAGKENSGAADVPVVPRILNWLPAF